MIESGIPNRKSLSSRKMNSNLEFGIEFSSIGNQIQVQNQEIYWKSIINGSHSK